MSSLLFFLNNRYYRTSNIYE